MFIALNFNGRPTNETQTHAQNFYPFFIPFTRHSIPSHPVPISHLIRSAIYVILVISLFSLLLLSCHNSTTRFICVFHFSRWIFNDVDMKMEEFRIKVSDGIRRTTTAMKTNTNEMRWERRNKIAERPKHIIIWLNKSFSVVGVVYLWWSAYCLHITHYLIYYYYL